MASPTAPTLATLVSEGLKKAGHASPAAALTTRAQDYWMEEIKNDVFTIAKKLRSLQTTAVTVLTKGLCVIHFLPTFDRISPLPVCLAIKPDGQIACRGHPTLAATDGHTEEWMLGKEILITSGTGVGGLSQCTAFDTSTRLRQ